MKNVEELNAKIRFEHAAALRKVEELSNSMMVLRDRVETLKLALDRKKRTAEVSENHQPKPRVTPKPDAKVSSAPQGEPFLMSGGFSDRQGSAIRLTNRDLVAMEARVDQNAPEMGSAIDDDPDAISTYNQAYKSFTDEKYEKAVGSLENFVQRFPDHAYADNAVFWIGESHFRGRDFEKAVEQFERVAREFPSGNKVPEALLRAGSCYLHLSRPDVARKTFSRVIQLYPKSVAARKAREWISEISDAAPRGRM